MTSNDNSVTSTALCTDSDKSSNHITPERPLTPEIREIFSANIATIF